ncbi:MAG: AraC family transcriptional regulator [Thermomicrobiales bacterium]
MPAGLEGLCEDSATDWIRHVAPIPGVQVLEAWLPTVAYRRHRHDVYAIGLTDVGIQAFSYRGEGRISLPGQVAVLHPDEAHDGRAGTDAGFGYRLLYIEPALIAEAVRAERGHRATLPFVSQPVIDSAALAAAVRFAFGNLHEPLARDHLIAAIAHGLLAATEDSPRHSIPRQIDLAAIGRVRHFLAAETRRIVRSEELEAISGLTRFDLARQFRAGLGTSPYRYSLARRLERARAMILAGESLADIALETGFADQAHFTRQFVAAYGLSPRRYHELQVGETHHERRTMP